MGKKVSRRRRRNCWRRNKFVRRLATKSWSGGRARGIKTRYIGDERGPIERETMELFRGIITAKYEVWRRIHLRLGCTFYCFTQRNLFYMYVLNQPPCLYFLPPVKGKRWSKNAHWKRKCNQLIIICPEKSELLSGRAKSHKMKRSDKEQMVHVSSCTRRWL